MKMLPWEMVLRDLILYEANNLKEKKKEEDKGKDVIFFFRNGYTDVSKEMILYGLNIGNHGDQWQRVNCLYENFHGTLFRKVLLING